MSAVLPRRVVEPEEVRVRAVSPPFLVEEHEITGLEHAQPLVPADRLESGGSSVASLAVKIEAQRPRLTVLAAGRGHGDRLATHRPVADHVGRACRERLAVAIRLVARGGGPLRPQRRLRELAAMAVD